MNNTASSSENFVQTVSRTTKNKAECFEIVSLFAGCGGLDLGFIGGFKVGRKVFHQLPHQITWANEIDTYACKIYRQNMKHDIHQADIREILAKKLLPSKGDILLGGFPCQDFSQAGKRKGFASDRGVLYKSMVEAVKQIKPKVFIAENVKGIMSIPDALNTIKHDFSAIGYHGVQEYEVQAADYGVPQNRQRVFIIGWKNKKHADAFDFPVIASPKRTTTKQAIDDIKEQPWGGVDGHTWALAKYRKGLQGNETMPANDIAYTIRAEHHMNIQFHYDKDRRISVREAARLQTFPDDFLLGTVSKNQGYKMVGNAVPPVLAWHLAKAVRETLIK